MVSCGLSVFYKGDYPVTFLLPSIIIYMKQNHVHKVIILYLYIRGRNDYCRWTKRLGGRND